MKIETGEGRRAGNNGVAAVLVDIAKRLLV